MKVWVGAIRNERGVALPLALFALVMLTGLLLAFLTMGGMEPTIAANLNDVTRARYLADAGIEFAFDQLAAAPLTGTGSWSDTLGKGGNVITGQSLPGLPATLGTYTVTLRNDNQAGDNRITALTACNAQGATDCGPANPNTTDNNNLVILTATGTYQGVSRQIQVVVRRLQIPPLPGALNCGGLQCDFDMGVVSDWTNHHFHAVGLDYAQDPSNPANMVGVSGNMKYGIATPTGKQANTNKAFETSVEDVLNKHQINETDGQDQTQPAGTPVVSRQYDGAGKKAIAADSQLVSKTDGSGNFVSNPISDFVNMLKGQPSVNLLQSQTGCACNLIVQNGKPIGANKDLPVNLGTVQKPAITYFRGDPTNPSNPNRVLVLQGTNSGAGILIVEDGNVQVNDSFRWDGVIIVTGKNVGITFRKSVQASVYGGVILNETRKDQDNPSYDLQLEKNCTHSEDSSLCGGNDDNWTKMYSSMQRVTQAQGIRSLVKVSTWREL